LDSILSIPDLDALQWVPGAGNLGYHRWVEVYQRAQTADKGIQVNCEIGEVDLVIETLDPHGVYLSVSGVPSVEAAEEMLVKLEKWAVGRG
jgi:hypothetical protein